MSNTNTTARTIFRRAAAAATLAVAPLLIALGASAVSHADTGSTDTSVLSTVVSTQQGPQRNQDIVGTYLPHTSLSHHQRHAYQY